MIHLSSERGSALLIVLIIVAVCSAAVIGFSYNAVVELKSAAAFRDRTVGSWAVYGGIIAAGEMLQVDDNRYDVPSELWGQRNVIALNEQKVEISIDELNGRISINNLVTAMGNINVVQMERLIRLFDNVGISESETKVRMIADLLDYDSNPRVSQMDSGYPNAPILNTRELVKYGILSEKEFQNAAAFISADGDVNINVNTAPLMVLKSLADELDEIDARLIVDRRGTVPLKNVDELKEIPGSENWFHIVSTNLNTTSRHYAIQAETIYQTARVKRTALYDKNEQRILYWMTP